MCGRGGEALTHASVKAADPTRLENGRLAFLGDAVLDLVVGEYHFDAKTRLSKHDLTKQRAEFVANKVIGAIPSQRLQIPLITGDSIAGGSSTANMRATALEAVIGAVYLDGGMTKARQVALDVLGLTGMEREHS